MMSHKKKPKLRVLLEPRKWDMESPLDWTSSVLGQGEMGQHPTAKGFSLQEKWDKKINALCMLGEVCGRKSVPRGRAEGFMARNSSWEGHTQLEQPQECRDPSAFGRCSPGRGVRRRWDCRTAALQRLIFPNMFIITLHYLNYQQEKWGEREGRERRKVERQGRCRVMSNSQPPSAGPRLRLELEIMLLIQCLFISHHKKMEAHSE